MKVLIVDDSALMRELLSEVFKSTADLEVVGAARNAQMGFRLLRELRPDVVTLDVEMPGMNGIEFLRKVMAECPVPVVMVSSLTARGGEMAMRALEAGAVDVVEKPSLDVRSGTLALSQELIYKVRAASRARVGHAPVRAMGEGALRGEARTPRSSHRLVAIGASTGGTEALLSVLSKLPPGIPPVVVVQHMPAHFTQAFAQRLDRHCQVRVKEAADGDLLVSGWVFLAPGGRQMRVLRSGDGLVVRITDEPPVGLHRPSVDVLFESCARAVGGKCAGVILTGMGADGAYGLGEMHKAGARTYAQDEASCVVFGMPKEAIARGAVDHVLPLDRMASAVMGL